MSEHLSPRTTRFSQQGKLLIHTYLREIRPIDTEKRRWARRYRSVPGSRHSSRHSDFSLAMQDLKA